MIVLWTSTIDPHADVLVDRLTDLGVEFLRLNYDRFPTQIQIKAEFNSNGWKIKFHLPLGRVLDCDAITAVWCRRQPSSIVSQSISPPEAQQLAKDESSAVISGVVLLLEDRYWMNHPQHQARANSKLLQLQVAQKLGFTVPKTEITNIPKSFLAFHQQQSKGKSVSKLIGIPRALVGHGYLIYTNTLSPEVLLQANKVTFCPTLIQEYVEKAVELRVTVVGKEVFAMQIDSQRLPDAKIDWRRTGAEQLKKIAAPTQFPVEEAKRCVRYLRQFGLEYGAFDFILTPRDELVFLEINPHGAWGFVEYITGFPISSTIAQCLAGGIKTN